MTRDELAGILASELGKIAPEIDFDAADPDEDLRDEFDIDSMDFLNLMTALGKRFGITVPETDYPRFDTLSHAIDYLAEKAEGGG